MPGFAIRGPSIPIQAAATAAVSGAASAVAGQSVPAWTGTPSPTIYEGIAGSYTLPVTGITGNVAWSQPGSAPAWISFTGNVLSWTSAATQQTISGVVLRATNAAGTSDSAAFPLTVSAAPSSTGFFAGTTVSRQALQTFGREVQPMSLPSGSKHTRFVSHPNGRDYLFGGDWPNGIGAESGAQTQYSYDPGRSDWRLEHPYWPADGNVYPVHHDKSSVAWDSKRRRFWMVGGFNFGTGSDAPANKTPVIGKVMYFDPALPQGTQWRDTGVAYQSSFDLEQSGNAVYDPVLDVVIVFHPRVGWGRLQVWDCAGSQWLNDIEFTALANLEIGNSGTLLDVLSIDPVARRLYVLLTTNYNDTKLIYKVTLPSVRAGSFSVGGALLNLAGAAALVWDNTSAIKLGGGCVVEDGPRRKLYFWKKGPIGNDANAPGTDIGRAAVGQAGRAFTNNAAFGSADTGLLIDLDTGATEATQLPIPVFNDGQGWVIPFQTHYSPRDGALWYGTSKFEWADAETPQPTVESNVLVIKKPVPSWVQSLAQNAWYTIPNSDCATSLPTAIRTFWSGPEASGYRGITLSAAECPWSFSGMAFRKRESVCLFHGGGGGDGAGNGILGFVLNAEAPYWTMPMPPTPLSKVLDNAKRTQEPWASNGTQFTREFNYTFADPTVESTPRSPVAVHAYTNCQYIDADDVWLRFGSNMVHPTDGGRFDGVHGFYWSETAKPYDNRQWAINTRATMPAMGAEVRSYVKHPWTEDVLVARTVWNELRYWNRATDTWAYMGTMPNELYTPMGIDPVNNVCLMMWGANAPVLVDLGSATTYSGNAGSSWIGTGAAEFVAAHPMSACMTWDDDNQCLWALKASHIVNDTSFDLFKLTLASKSGCVWNVTKVSTTVAANSVRPDFTGLNQSIYNRFQWVPELGGLVLNTSYSRPHWFIKTSNRV